MLATSLARRCRISGPAFFSSGNDEHQEDDDDTQEELHVVAALEAQTEAPTPKQKMSPMQKTSQNYRNKQPARQEYVPELIPDIVAELAGKPDKGEITFFTNRGNTKQYLADSGSKPHVANAAKHVLGAKARPSKEEGASAGCTAADGSHISSDGEVEGKCLSIGGHMLSIANQHADVQFPIISTGRMADA